MRLALAFLGFVVCLSCAAPALADAFPPPTRPEWNDPPAPLPAPPEDEAWRFVVPAAVVAAAGAMAARYRRVARGAA